MYYAKKRKTLGEPPYDTGVPAAPSVSQPTQPGTQPSSSHIAVPISPGAQQLRPTTTGPVTGGGVYLAPIVPFAPVMQPVPQAPAAPRPTASQQPAYTPPTQAIYADSAYTPAANVPAAGSSLPTYDPVLAAQQQAQKQAQQAAAAAQTTYIQPQYAPATPAAPKATASQRRAQAEQRRRDMELRRKQQKAAQDAAAKARRDAQTKAQRKAQDEYNKQQKKAYESQKRADEAYAKQVEAQEKAAVKQREEQAKLARKNAEQQAKQQAAAQQQYQQQQAALQRQTEETRAKVEAESQPKQTYAPISTAPSPSEYLPSDYPGGAAPPQVKTPQAQALAQKIYFTNKDVAATQKRWGDGTSEYTVSSGDRLLKEIIRRGAELEKMKSMRTALTPNQRKLANSVLHSTQKELEKMAGDIASKYSTATAASFDSERYGEAVSDLASTWNNKFNEMVQRVDLLQQIQNPSTAPYAIMELQQKLTPEERAKFNYALGEEVRAGIQPYADKIAAQKSPGFFESMFAAPFASSEAIQKGQKLREAAVTEANVRDLGPDYKEWMQQAQTPEAPQVTGWFQPPSVAEKMALEMQHTQMPYFEAPTQAAIETAVAPQPSVAQRSQDAAAQIQQALQQQEAETAAVRQRFDTAQQTAARDFNYFNVDEHPQGRDVVPEPQYDTAQVEQFVQSAWQQGMTPEQFNRHYGPGYPSALLSTTEQNIRDRRVKEAEQIVIAARQQNMSPEQFNQHYGPGYSEAELAQAAQNVAAAPVQVPAYGAGGPVGPVGSSGSSSGFLDKFFGATQFAKDTVSTGKLVSSPVSLLDPKNLGPKLFNLDRPGQMTPRVSAVPIDFVMRAGKDFATPYVQEVAQSFVGPEYQQEARDAAAAGTKWVGKALVDTPAGDVARTYATEYIFERGPVGNTFGAAAKSVGGRARGLLQAIPGAAAAGEASYGVLRTLLNPRVTAAGAIASGVYDTYRVGDAAFAAHAAMDAAKEQEAQTQRVQTINVQQMQADERKLATSQRALQHRISLYEEALTAGDFYVPAQSADHFRRQELKQQMRAKLPELRDALEKTTAQLQELRANMQSQPAMGPIFAEEARARAEAEAIEQANMPMWEAGGF